MSNVDGRHDAAVHLQDQQCSAQTDGLGGQRDDEGLELCFFNDVAIEAADTNADEQADGAPQQNAAQRVVHLGNGDAVGDADDATHRQIETAGQQDEGLADGDQNKRKCRIAFVSKVAGTERVAVQTAHNHDDQDQHDIWNQSNPVICQLFAQRTFCFHE